MEPAIILENAQVRATFKTKGAELTSLIHKGNELEYIWQADPQIWNRHAPVLFPIVGRLKNDTYSYRNDWFRLSQHGFARDLEYELEGLTEDALKFVLNHSEKTLVHSGFKFKLVIGYKLKATTLTVSYEVFNESEEPLFFSIGAHPAFRCPLTDKGKFEDYYLEFNEAETLERHLLTDGVFDGTTEVVMDNANILPLTYELFEKDALVFKKFKSNTVTLKSRKEPRGLKVSFPGFPYLGIWTKQKGAPFICIEPWYGLADSTNTSGDLVEKEGVMKLEPAEEFDCHYQIEIF
jgi:galactose mutarotase-like enzyme